MNGDCVQRRVWRVAVAAALAAALAACSGGGGGDDSDPFDGGAGGGGPQSHSVTLDTPADATRFLKQASFGGTQTDIANLTNTEATSWLTRQFSLPTVSYVPLMLEQQRRGVEYCCRDQTFLFWDNIITADDQLRQRMVFALSQIVVASDFTSYNQPLRVAYYMDILGEHAFGNYRDLLEAVTYSPLMANYLTYLNNRKGSPASGRMPDENYAREIMQLFTIGLVELNMDGTPRTAGGQPVETYDNDDVVGLARVFTGLGYKSDEDAFRDRRRRDADAEYRPLQIYPEFHSDLEKAFLDTVIPPGTDAATSIDMALDALFNHPNVAPFISRQLIQRFTSSNPPPAYVQRVAEAFQTGRYVAPNGVRFGTGERGDLEATLAAVLLDEVAFTPAAQQSDEHGKVREPVLRFIHWARAFEVSAVSSANQHDLYTTSDATAKLAQHPFRAPSVFNFYRPGYVAPGTETGERGLTAPELQIVNESSAIGYTNFMMRYVYGQSARVNRDFATFVPDYTEEIALADDPQTLVEHLDVLLTSGRMTDGTKEQIVATVSELRLRVGTENEDRDRRDRAQLAVLMAVTAPAYTILR